MDYFRRFAFDNLQHYNLQILIAICAFCEEYKPDGSLENQVVDVMAGNIVKEHFNEASVCMHVQLVDVID
jgi:hypothetical protein